MSLVWRDTRSTHCRILEGKVQGYQVWDKLQLSVLANQRKAARVAKRRNAADEATITMIPHLRWLSWQYVLISKGVEQ